MANTCEEWLPHTLEDVLEKLRGMHTSNVDQVKFWLAIIDHKTRQEHETLMLDQNERMLRQGKKMIRFTCVMVALTAIAVFVAIREPLAELLAMVLD